MSEKRKYMTPNQFKEQILSELLKEKGEIYVNEICKKYSAKDAQDRYRLKKSLLKLLRT